MAKVSIDINGRKYALGCDDGEEERLLRLGQKLDDRVKMLANQFGQIGDIRLLVMAGITLTDELDEFSGNIEAQVEKVTTNIRKESETAIAQSEESSQEATASLMKAADRIDAIASRLARSND